MTLARALEFSTFTKLDRFETERLIHLTFAESDDLHVKSHFQKKLRSVNDEITEHTSTVVDSEEIIADPDLNLLFEFYLWYQQQLPPEAIREMLPFHPHLTSERIAVATNTLISKGLIAHEPDGRVKALIDKMIFSNQNERFRDYHKDMAAVYAKMLDIDTKPRAFFSGRIQLSKDRFEEVQKEVFRLKNWILEFGEEARTTASDPRKQNLLCQFGAYVFPLVDDSK